MKGLGQGYVGRAGQGHSAGALVVPVARQREDGSWERIENGRVLFPPSGTVECRSGGLREGDWAVFEVAPKDRLNATVDYRALGIRPLPKFMNLADPTAEGARRLFVETGLETGAAGEFALRSGPKTIVKVRLSRGSDGRWRAPSAAALAARLFDPSLIVAVPTSDGSELFYDFNSAELSEEAVDWSRDNDLLEIAIRATGDPVLLEALDEVLKRIANPVAGTVSLIGGRNPGMLMDAVRHGAIAERIAKEGEALHLFRAALRSDPALRQQISEEIKKRCEDKLPALKEVARKAVESEMASEVGVAKTQAKTVIAELEAEEMAALEKRRSDREEELVAELAEVRQKELAFLRSDFEGLRRREEEEIELLQRRKLELQAETDTVANAKASLEDAVAGLAAERGRIEEALASLNRAEARFRQGAGGVPSPGVLTGGADGRCIGLSEVREAASSFGLLSDSGVDSIVKAAALWAAGEVPLLSGGGSADFLEAAALLLSSGRLVRLHADPTIVTFEDLWVRTGGAGATILVPTITDD